MNDMKGQIISGAPLNKMILLNFSVLPYKMFINNVFFCKKNKRTNKVIIKENFK